MLVRLAWHALWIGTALRLLVPSVADPDLWGHLLFGALLLEGTLPAVNGFAYTAPAHPWVNHELLAEIAMAAVYRAGGPPGLVALKTVLGLATLLLVWRVAWRRARSRAVAALATVAVALVLAPGLMIRPQLFTLLFLAATLGVLAAEGWRPRGRAWALPLLVVVWVNTHGGVLSGVGLAGVGVASALGMRLWRGAAGKRDLAGTAFFAATLAGALLCNPWGVGLVRFLLTEVTPTVPITEWAPVPLANGSFLGFKLVVLAALLALARGHALAAEVPVVLAAAIAALLHRRHIPLFAIAVAPLLAAQIAELWAWARTRLTPPALRPLRVGVVAVAALQLGLAAGIALRAGGRILVDPWAYPVQALRFLAQNDLAGNVALPFRWGEYALWTLPPGSRVAIDGRFTTAYPEAVIQASWRFMSGAEGWETLLDDYPTDIVVADRRQAPARLLQAHPEWEYVYSDPVSFVFVRRVPSQAPALARFHAGELHYDQSPLALEFPAAHAPAPALAHPSADCRHAARALGSPGIAAAARLHATPPFC